MSLHTCELLVGDPEARLVVLLPVLPHRSARVELQGDQPAPHSDHQRLGAGGPVVGAELTSTEPVVTDGSSLAEAPRDLEVVLHTVL